MKMEQQTEHYNPAEITNEKKERVALGLLGALLFSLAGAVLYLILRKVGYIASITGLATAYISFFGYGLFSGNKESKKGMIAAAVFAVLITAIACFIAYTLELYEFLKKDNISLAIPQLISNALNLLKGSEISFVKGLYEYSYTYDSSVFYKDLGMSLLFCGLGIFGFIRSTNHKVRAKEQDGAQQ